MAIHSFPFVSVANDRSISAATFAAHMAANKTPGAAPNLLNGLATFPTNPASRAVLIETGGAYVGSEDQGWMRFLLNDASITLSIAAAHSTLARNDLVIFKTDLSQSERETTIEIKQGTPSATPVDPGLTQTAAVWEHGHARVIVRAGTSTIVTGDITSLGSGTGAQVSRTLNIINGNALPVVGILGDIILQHTTLPSTKIRYSATADGFSGEPYFASNRYYKGVDASADYIYITAKDERIRRIDRATGDVTTLVAGSNTTRSVSIAVTDTLIYVLWNSTYGGGTIKIGRYNLDGSSAGNVLTLTSPNTGATAIAATTDRIYVLDRTDRTIYAYTTGLVGLGSENVVFNNPPYPEWGLVRTSNRWYAVSGDGESEPDLRAYTVDGVDIPAESAYAASSAAPRPRGLGAFGDVLFVINDDVIESYDLTSTPAPQHIHNGELHGYISDGTAWTETNTIEIIRSV